MTIAEHSSLGKPARYQQDYSPELLFPIARETKRTAIGVPTPLPFYGYDRWTAFELSWLDPRGKPQVAIAVIDIPCTSPFLIESKSLKLYFNSFNQTRFESIDHVKATIEKDLSQSAGTPVSAKLLSPQSMAETTLVNLPGQCIDEAPIETNVYDYHPEFLSASGPIVSETLHSHLLKSNCLVTNQPDWASILIEYTGPQIDHENLLKYIISFRLHNDFHEQCVETIFMDLLRRCKPSLLTVYACYTRRGGIDINPFRSIDPHSPLFPLRLVRQ